TALVGVFLYLLFGRPVIAAGLAMLFGLHPLSVESVCWISERKTVLAAFFALWSLIFYVRFTREGERWHFVACCVAYALALLSKPIAVPLPAMMLLIDHWPLNRLDRKAIVEKWPLFVLGVLSAIVILVSQQRTAPAQLPGDYNPWQVPLILCHNIVFYLHKYFWPVALSAYYGFPVPMGLRSPTVLIGVVGTCLLIPLLVLSHRRTRAPLTGWLIFFIMIFPAMGIISVTPTIAANRYLYLPSLGFLMVLGALLKWLGTVAPKGRKAMTQLAIVGVLLAAAGTEAVALRRYQSQWSDTVKLHEYLLATEPHATKLNSSLGVELASRGQFAQAVEFYRRALESSPDDKVTHYNLALALSRQGTEHTDEVIEHYRKALEEEPKFIVARLNLGNVFLDRGDCSRALEQYQEILKIQSDFAPAKYNIGRVMVFSDKSAEGIECLREAVRLHPGFLMATRDLAWFLATHPNAEVRDANEAIRLAERAEAMTQGRDATMLDTLAAAYASDGRYRKATETAEKALALAKRVANHELAAEIEERLRLYQLECPCYENPKVQLERMVTRWKTAEHGPEAAELATEAPKLNNDNSTREVQNEAETIAAR
ncbi:MAG: tetratricopeptide repeat protein, partial [Phycisphaerales bacterium]